MVLADGVLMDGKKLASKIEEDIIKETKELAIKGIVPSLAVILVGNDSASQTYVTMKAKACKRVGITSILYEMPTNTSEQDLLQTIDSLNKNDQIDGILVQLPLPEHINASEILDMIAPHKDVDGFHTQNSGKLHSGLKGFVPATPLGVMTLLRHYNIDIKGKDVCIVGASNIVGKPLSALMLNAGATISVCHILTKDLSFYTKNADIVCVGVGKPNLITKDMIKEGAIVVDIGINRLENGKIVCDVDLDNLRSHCYYITPVPGGVGHMTISSLLQKTLESAKKRPKR